MNAAEFADLKRSLLQLLPDEGIGAVLIALKKALPESSPKFTAVFHLETRLNMANRDKIRGILSPEQLELTYNRISADLIELIDGLEEADFSAAGAHKTGSILYKIPRTMQVEQEKRCIVRLAFEEDVIIQNIELTDAVLKSIRVSEVMEVTLVDPNEDPAFTIRQVNSTEQFLEKGDFTEWVFYVKPLRIGEYPLALRASVVEVVNGRDRKKEIVLEETIHVVAEPEDDGFEETTTFKNAGYTFSYRPESEAAAEEPSEKANTLRRLAPALLILFILAGGAWALGLRQEFAWMLTQQEDSRNGYTQYLERYPEGRHRKQALHKLDSLDWLDAVQAGTDSSYFYYWSRHPQGAYEPEARRILDSLRRADPVLDSLVNQHLQSVTPPQDSGLVSNSPVSELPPVENQPKKPKPAKKPVSPPKKQPALPPAPLPKMPTGSTAEPALPDSVTVAAPNKRRSGFEMVLVPGGDYQMGNEKGDKDECPHQVAVSTFHIGKYEVTQQDWKEVMGANPSFYKGCDECPVEQVSWNDIQEFLQKAGALHKVRFRLPTEEEWEYAARGGRQSQNLAYAGSKRAGAVAWYHGNTERPNRVGRKKANELGLHDMSGNVWEWCQDLYQPYPGCKGKASLDRILRGGSWRNYDQFCRVSNRNQEKPEKRDYQYGFRLARD